ncbi:MAG TPA: DUF1800 domain-containing protein [Fimbriimonas sp.]
MNLSRREWIALAGTALAAGCAPLAARATAKAQPEDFETPGNSEEPGRRLYNRAGFGPRPGNLARYREQGHARTVEQLLRADEPEDAALMMQLMRLDVLRVDPAELHDLKEETILAQLQQAAILRAVYGRNPLLERMSEFWTDHLNIFGKKRPAAWHKGADETKVVRRHALGSFPEMVRESARSPAMLTFLDGTQNQKGQPNENYARELMELHTLGVDGGYTQDDVMEVARCFSGWTVEDRFLRPRGRFRFDPDRHDAGEKRVLGTRIPAGGGIEDGEKVIEIVCAHPATARHLARKLVRKFVGTESPKLESQVEKAYWESRGEIREMLGPILTSRELLEGPPILKRPFDLVVSALRALDATTDAGNALQDHLEAMGQPIYQWPMPDGYPVETDAWSGSMLPRWRFAFALGAGALRGTSFSDGLVPATIYQALMGDDRVPLDLSGQDAASMAGLCIASPGFQWR